MNKSQIIFCITLLIGLALCDPKVPIWPNQFTVK